MQASFLLLPAILVFGRRPAWGAILLFLVTLGCLPWFLAGLERRAPALADERPAFTVACANVLNTNRIRGQAIAAAERVDADLLCLVEVDVRDRQASSHDPRWTYQIWPEVGGMALLSTRPFLHQRILPQEFSAWIEATISIDGVEVRVLTVHTTSPKNPHRVRNRAVDLNRISAWARQAPGPLIVLGDFNLTVGDPTWRDLRAASGLRRPAGHEPATWPAPAAALGITIDHILARDLALGTPQAIWLPGSDHRGLVTRVGSP